MVKKSAWNGAHDGQCDVETRAPDGEDAVIAEAKPRTLRKRRPASQPVWLVSAWAGGRGRAIAARVMH